MATILNGDIQVDYLDSNRQKRLSWLGGTNTSYTMNEIYSAMATLLDETTTIDDGTCFSAETPVEYTIGKIDTGDTEPWYITFDLMEHVTGGALRTSGWERVETTNTGIVVVPVSSGGSIASTDEGETVTHGDGDSGTILEVIITGGSTDYVVIRPDSSASTDSFDTGSGTLTVSAAAVHAWKGLSLASWDHTVCPSILRAIATTFAGSLLTFTIWTQSSHPTAIWGKYIFVGAGM